METKFTDEQKALLKELDRLIQRCQDNGISFLRDMEYGGLYAIAVQGLDMDNPIEEGNGYGVTLDELDSRYLAYCWTEWGDGNDKVFLPKAE